VLMFPSDHANDKGNNNGKDRQKLARSLKPTNVIDVLVLEC
jgi:hypothetical protein